VTGIRKIITALAAGTAAAVAYRRLLAPVLMTWGATDDEVAGPFRGDELIPEGERGPTMAVTIAATTRQVWPWLVQMGWDRGGFYSWDLLDNAGRPSAREVHPEWQDLAVGDRLKCLGLPSYEVAILDSNHFLGLYALTDLRGRPLDPSQPRPSAYIEGLWGFCLNELPGGRTRLVIGGYQAGRPRWLGRLIYDWIFPLLVWIMQARMLKVLKRNAEQESAASAAPAPVASPTPTVTLPAGSTIV
jgi:proline iminopeptidase